MEKGIYVGRTVDSNEYLLATPTGTYTSRTVKRLPVGHRYDREVLNKIIGTPWNRECSRPAKKQAKMLPMSGPLPAATSDKERIDEFGQKSEEKEDPEKKTEEEKTEEKPAEEDGGRQEGRKHERWNGKKETETIETQGASNSG